MARQTGYRHSEATLQKMREACKNRASMSEATRGKLRAFHTGRTASEATKEKMSEAHSGAKNPMYGKKFSVEYRLKLSKAQSGRTLSEDTRRKIGEACKGIKSHFWIADRTKLVKKQERNDSAYHDWRRQVRDRDKWECRIADEH